jgi:hypothetical protein
VQLYRDLTRIGIIIHCCMTNNVNARVCTELLRVTKRVYMSSSNACAASPVKRLLSYCAEVGSDVSALDSLFRGNASAYDFNDLNEPVDVPIELLSLQYDYLDLGSFAVPWGLWIQVSESKSKPNPAKKRKTS